MHRQVEAPNAQSRRGLNSGYGEARAPSAQSPPKTGTTPGYSYSGFTTESSPLLLKGGQFSSIKSGGGGVGGEKQVNISHLKKKKIKAFMLENSEEYF